jgi:hypothetical protein
MKIVVAGPGRSHLTTCSSFRCLGRRCAGSEAVAAIARDVAHHLWIQCAETRSHSGTTASDPLLRAWVAV